MLSALLRARLGNVRRLLPNIKLQDTLRHKGHGGTSDVWLRATHAPALPKRNIQSRRSHDRVWLSKAYALRQCQVRSTNSSAGAKHRGKRRDVSSGAAADGIAAGFGGVAGSSGRWSEFAEEAQRLSRLAVPLSIQNVATYSASVIGMAFVGRLGTSTMSAVVLGNSIFIVMGISLMSGVASAMETLCGQAYGAKNYTALGVVFQRALAICGVLLLIVVGIWTQMDTILMHLGQDPGIASKAARYVVLCTPALVGISIAECAKRYLMAQGVVKPLTIISFIATGLMPFFSWFFIYHWHMGLDGAAMAINCMQITSALLLVAYLGVRERRLMGTPFATWPGWSKEALQMWPQYLGIAVPSTLMHCLEWWVYEAMTVLSGLLPSPEMAMSVVGICFSATSLVYQIPMGLAGAASTRVANELGAGNWRGARTSAITVTLMCFGVLSLLGCAVVWGRELIPWAFVQDAEIVRLTAVVMPVVGISVVGDGINCVLSGIVRACGRQRSAAMLNILSYWVIGFPLVLYLAFPMGYGVTGLWGGIAITSSMQSFLLGAMVFRFDWQKEAGRALTLINAGKRPGHH